MCTWDHEWNEVWNRLTVRQRKALLKSIGVNTDAAYCDASRIAAQTKLKLSGKEIPSDD